MIKFHSDLEFFLKANLKSIGFFVDDLFFMRKNNFDMSDAFFLKNVAKLTVISRADPFPNFQF